MSRRRYCRPAGARRLSARLMQRRSGGRSRSSSWRTAHGCRASSTAWCSPVQVHRAARSSTTSRRTRAGGARRKMGSAPGLRRPTPGRCRPTAVRSRRSSDCRPNASKRGCWLPPCSDPTKSRHHSLYDVVHVRVGENSGST